MLLVSLSFGEPLFWKLLRAVTHAARQEVVPSPPLSLVSGCGHLLLDSSCRACPCMAEHGIEQGVLSIKVYAAYVVRLGRTMLVPG